MAAGFGSQQLMTCVRAKWRDRAKMPYFTVEICSDIAEQKHIKTHQQLVTRIKVLLVYIQATLHDKIAFLTTLTRQQCSSLADRSRSKVLCLSGYWV